MAFNGGELVFGQLSACDGVAGSSEHDELLPFLAGDVALERCLLGGVVELLVPAEVYEAASERCISTLEVVDDNPARRTPQHREGLKLELYAAAGVDVLAPLVGVSFTD